MRAVCSRSDYVLFLVRNGSSLNCVRHDLFSGLKLSQYIADVICCHLILSFVLLESRGTWSLARLCSRRRLCLEDAVEAFSVL
jgi:hypothetical protein